MGAGAGAGTGEASLAGLRGEGCALGLQATRGSTRSRATRSRATSSRDTRPSRATRHSRGTSRARGMCSGHSREATKRVAWKLGAHCNSLTPRALVEVCT